MIFLPSIKDNWISDMHGPLTMMGPWRWKLARVFRCVLLHHMRQTFERIHTARPHGRRERLRNEHQSDRWTYVLYIWWFRVRVHVRHQCISNGPCSALQATLVAAVAFCTSATLKQTHDTVPTTFAHGEYKAQQVHDLVRSVVVETQTKRLQLFHVWLLHRRQDKLCGIAMPDGCLACTRLQQRNWVNVDWVEPPIASGSQKNRTGCGLAVMAQIIFLSSNCIFHRTTNT